MPHIVDADVDNDNCRFQCQDVAVDATEEIGNPVSTDTGTDNLNIGTCTPEVILNQSDIATRLDT